MCFKADTLTAKSVLPPRLHGRFLSSEERTLLRKIVDSYQMTGNYWYPTGIQIPTKLADAYQTLSAKILTPVMMRGRLRFGGTRAREGRLSLLVFARDFVERRTLSQGHPSSKGHNPSFGHAAAPREQGRGRRGEHGL